VKFSIVIPARNEETYLGACLDSIAAAARPYPGQVEIIVALNRCTDRTEEIARAHGALVLQEEGKNLARIRNAAARRAQGEILITIDADSRMTPNMLAQIDRALRTGRYVGGGVLIRLERMSLGIIVSCLALLVFVVWHGLSGGLFWCYRRDFEAVAGFDERFVSAEDVDFAKRLKAHGRKQGKRFTMLWRASIVTSCRKFDRFGDWYLLKHPDLMWTILKGRNQEAANDLFYDFKR
jgi:glycosyltransferase involved in cell wall biosynthesis